MAAMLLFAPLIRGGNRQVAMSVLLGLGLAILAVLIARQTFRWVPLGHRTAAPDRHEAAGQAGSPLWWLVVLLVAAAPMWVALVQLVPLPARWWDSLAGHENYLAALNAAGAAPGTALPLSLNPSATWAAMWSAVPLTAVFLAALLLRRDAIDWLLGLMVVAAIVQVVLALFQVVQGADSFFYFGSRSPGGVNGSFNNRNHLADLLAMLIPVWFYFLLRQQRDRGAAAASASWMTHAALRPLWLFLGFTLMVLILMTQSRGGLFSGIVVLLISAVVYLVHLGSRISFRQRLGMLAVVGVFGIAALASVGTEGISARLQGERLRSDADVRTTYATSTFQGAKRLWPWGSGVGSFESVFPRFQEMDSVGFVEYAHNDYPQLLMELGAPVLLIGAALAGLVVFQFIGLIRAGRRDGGHHRSAALPLRWFCGIGALALLMHSRVEFNMHIPALAITATFLAGVFLRPVQADS